MAEALTGFWSMGGYGAYVWSSYGIAAAVLIANIVAPLLSHRRLKRRIGNGDFDD